MGWWASYAPITETENDFMGRKYYVFRRWLDTSSHHSLETITRCPVIIQRENRFFPSPPIVVFKGNLPNSLGWWIIRTTVYPDILLYRQLQSKKHPFKWISVENNKHMEVADRRVILRLKGPDFARFSWRFGGWSSKMNRYTINKKKIQHS